tara:strand:+ start:481 stop:948 length:468 start_codon:yes stop_codon:yes gene_type:complete
MSLEDRINLLENMITKLQTRLIRQEKAFRRFKKSLIPESEKVPRKPSGFARPSLLSNDMCEFLALPLNSSLPRTEVTKLILNYVKENNLQNPENKKLIVIDDKLQKLLQTNPSDNVSYFSIQKYLKYHYKPLNDENETEQTVVEKITPKKVKKSK